MRIKFSKFLIVFLSIGLPLIAFAKGLVPCGGQGEPACSVSCFFVLIDNVMKFLLYEISLPLAATAFMVAGIYLVAGGSENAIKRGKSIFVSTVIGLFIAFGAWLIIDMILGNLLSPGYLPWNQFPSSECTANPVSSSSLNTQTTSNGLTVNNPNTSTAVFNIDEGSYEDGIDTNTPGFQSLENQPPEGTGLSPDTNPSNNCNPAIAGNLVGANLNGVDPQRVEAIIQAESSGISTASVVENDGGRSYGLMQVRPDTARLYDSSLTGLSDSQIGDKLINDPKYNINIGTKYYSDLLNKYGDPSLASAAYNGGPLANKASVNCPGLKRWQCLYDNNNHTLLNERAGHPGYGPTRKYIQNINKFYSQC